MNQTLLINARLSPLPRPPALGPRRRTIDHAVQRRLRDWLRRALQLTSHTPIALAEWVSMDSRCIPHTLIVCIGCGDDVRQFVIEDAAERVRERDVYAVAAQPSFQAAEP